MVCWLWWGPEFTYSSRLTPARSPSPGHRFSAHYNGGGIPLESFFPFYEGDG